MSPAPKNPDSARDATRRTGGRQRGRQARPDDAQQASPARPDGAQAADPERPAGRPLPNTYRAPEYVIEVWISPEMRARNPNRPLTLCEVLKIGRQPKPGRQAEPDLEPEP